MPQNPLERITFQHVIYGAGTILAGRTDIRAALVQPDELEAALAHAKPLLEGPEHHHGNHHHGGPESNEPHDYGSSEAASDLRQVLSLYNATVVDGRYIDALATDPKAVAAKLDLELSDTAALAIEEARKAVVQRFGDTFAVSGGKKIVAIVIVGVIAIRAESKPYEVVVDSSGLIKV